MVKYQDWEIIKSNKELSDFLVDVRSVFCFCPFDGITKLAPTYDPYITLTSSGVKKEGVGNSSFYFTEKAAVDAYKKEFMKYARITGSSFRENFTLYWRMYPTIRLVRAKKNEECQICKAFNNGCGFMYCEKGIINHPDIYTVYSRLLISDKSVIFDYVQGLK